MEHQSKRAGRGDGSRARTTIQDEPTKQYFAHSSGQRTNTDSVIAHALHKQYPNLELSIVMSRLCNLAGFAATGKATMTPIEETSDDEPAALSWKMYAAPAKRMDGGVGVLAEIPLFGKFMYRWENYDFIVYLVDGRDGNDGFGGVQNYYILSALAHKADELIMAVGTWSNKMGDEVWVFDGGFWDRDPELYRSVMKASWDAVILDADMKEAIIEDHMSFFQSKDAYSRLKVPWKRGVIYHGPPGNGKTISIKAMMHTLYSLKEPIPTLYVRTLVSYMGPEYSLQSIFNMARRYAPCYLVFEDLDSIVSDDVRSYFLNEVDGLESNDGIFMIGSTNHLERLDPGISKRPSRFDRKYLFPNPDEKEREAYCHFWQSKLSDNKEIEFPDKLCGAIAKITGGFSFAYMQEAFVAALLALARKDQPKDMSKAMEKLTVEVEDEWVEVLDGPHRKDPALEKLVLWVEIKKQIEILREGIEDGGDQE